MLNIIYKIVSKIRNCAMKLYIYMLYKISSIYAYCKYKNHINGIVILFKKDFYALEQQQFLSNNSAWGFIRRGYKLLPLDAGAYYIEKYNISYLLKDEFVSEYDISNIINRCSKFCNEWKNLYAKSFDGINFAYVDISCVYNYLADICYIECLTYVDKDA